MKILEVCVHVRRSGCMGRSGLVIDEVHWDADASHVRIENTYEGDVNTSHV